MNTALRLAALAVLVLAAFGLAASLIITIDLHKLVHDLRACPAPPGEGA